MEEKKEEKQEEKKGTSPIAIIFSLLIIIFLIGGIAGAYYMYRRTITERDKWNNERLSSDRETNENEISDSKSDSNSNNYNSESSGEKELKDKDKGTKIDISDNKNGFYQKLNNGQPVRILIVGDEFALDKDEGGKAAWPVLFAEALKEKYGVEAELINLSLKGGNGNGIYSAYVQLENLADGRMDSVSLSKELKTKLEDSGEWTPDLLLISYGYYDDVFTYNLFYEGLLRTIRDRFPKAEIISVIESMAITNPEGNSDETALFTRELCEYYGGVTVNMAEAFADAIPPESPDSRDLEQAGSGIVDEGSGSGQEGTVTESLAGDEASEKETAHSPYASLCYEDGFPNEEGQKVCCKWLIDLIEPMVEEKHSQTEKLPKSMDSEADSFLTYAYVSSETFERVDDFTYILSASDLKKMKVPENALIGADYNSLAGHNNMNIYIDRKVFSGHIVEDGAGSERLIIIAGNHGRVSEDLIICFEDKFQADGFSGIAFSGDLKLLESSEEISELPLPKLEDPTS